MQTIKVQSGSDTILKLADGTSSVAAISEVIWNSLDAEAHEVVVEVNLGGLGGVETIVVTDDGHGMTYQQALDVFAVHGGSWKKSQKFSPEIKRPMHGKLGRGRFLVYCFASEIEWRTVAEHSGHRFQTIIRGRRSAPNAFEFEGPTEVDEETGTVVTITAQQKAERTRHFDASLQGPLTARLAPVLLALNDVDVTYLGVSLDPRRLVERDEILPLEVSDEARRGKKMPELRFVEWTQDMHSREVVLCDEGGAAVSTYELRPPPGVPVFWTAYLQWEGFGDPELMSEADLHHPSFKHQELLDKAVEVVVKELLALFEAHRGRKIAEWMAEGVYPYDGPPQSPVEAVEREIFDVVAVVASPAIGKDKRQKTFSLRLLQEAVRSEPSRAGRIIEHVFQLSDEDQEIFTELLDRTELGAMVRSARLVSDRLDFLRALGKLLYSDETRKVFREVDQLHPMLLKEPWVFGDEWTFSLSESGLRGVVEGFLSSLGSDVEFASDPVPMPDGKSGRVDLVFHKNVPDTDRTRHLVVELKRAGTVLSMLEYGQISNYATAITRHPQVAQTPQKWDFWLVGTSIDAAVEDQFIGTEPGLAHETSAFRIWIVTWGQLLDRAGRRMEAFRNQLSITSSEADARAYLSRVHAELVPEVAISSAE